MPKHSSTQGNLKSQRPKLHATGQPPSAWGLRPSRELEWFVIRHSFHRFKESLLEEQIRVRGNHEPERTGFVQVGRLVPERHISAHLLARSTNFRLEMLN